MDFAAHTMARTPTQRNSTENISPAKCIHSINGYLNTSYRTSIKSAFPPDRGEGSHEHPVPFQGLTSPPARIIAATLISLAGACYGTPGRILLSVQNDRSSDNNAQLQTAVGEESLN